MRKLILRIVGAIGLIALIILISSSMQEGSSEAFLALSGKIIGTIALIGFIYKAIKFVLPKNSPQNTEDKK